MTRTQQVAEQLQALMVRHGLTPSDLEHLTGSDGKAPISAVTIRRILKAEARTEPEPATLRRLAEMAGENYLTAFAEDAEHSVVNVEIHRRGARLFVHFVGGKEPEGLEADLRKVLDRHEKKLAATPAGGGGP